MKALFARLSSTCVLLATVAAQGSPALLTDVETSFPSNSGAFYEPERGVAWGPYLYFAADADGHGNELWRSTGAVGSAELVANIHVDAGSDPRPIGVLGGWLLLTADDGVSGRELWRTDGTAAGTTLLRDIGPGSAGSDPQHFVRYNNWYYFLAGEQLWKTDGQPGNTVAVSITNMPGATEIVASGSQLWIVADDNGTWKLWTSDGGSSVYFLIALPHEPVGLTGLPGIRCVFGCEDNNQDSELWTSNGTVPGTQRLVDINLGPNSSYPKGFCAANNVAYFRATDFASRLWRTDGTFAGTWAIDTPNGPRFPEHITAAGSRVFCRAQNAQNTNSEPWVSDGTTSGTYQLADVWPGNGSSGAADFAYDGTLWTYFSAHDGSAGYELWRTNLTLTERVSDIQPGLTDSSPSILGIANGYCLFAALHGTNDIELYSSQGNGSQLVRDLRLGTNGSSSPEIITPQVNGSFWFAGSRGALGREAYFSTGIPAGVQFLVDTVAGSESGMGPITRAASWGIYTFWNSMPGARLWRTAGTAPSTNQIPGLSVIYNDMVLFAGKLYVDGSTPATGEEIFVFDSPLVAPTLLKDCMPGTGGLIREMTVVGNRLFFVAQDPQSQVGYGNLWISDGTSAGTQQVYAHGLASTEPQQLRALGRKVLYTIGLTPTLVASDGTAAGTVTIGSLYATHERVVSGNRMFLAGEIPGSGTGVELIVTDGVTRQLVKDIRPGAASSDLYSLTPFGDGVLFIANDGSSGFELWKSDGTAAGTQMVVDLRAGAVSGCLSTGWNGVSYDGFVYAPRGAQRAVFVADNGLTGMELWRTDGTAAGTALLADIQPGVLGSWPNLPVRCGNQLVFAATQSEWPAAAIGRELFAMPSMAAAEPFGTPCASSLGTVPLADTVNAPALGSATFALRVSATPATAAFVVVGDPADVSASPCELHIQNQLFSLFVPTDAQGIGVQPLPLPNVPALSGLRFASQWAVLQNGAPYLGIAALSNGVDMVFAGQ